jgi:DNA repair/transcription protein MET18/MMS19
MSRRDALQVLSSISSLTSRPIEEHTLPLLFQQLPDVAPRLSAEEERLYIKQVLDSLSTLCTQPGLFEPLHIRLVNHFETLCAPRSSESDSMELEEDFVQRECQIAYAFSLLHAIRSTLERKIKAKHRDVAKHFDQLIPRIFGLFMNTSAETADISSDVRLMSEGAAIVTIMTQALPIE